MEKETATPPPPSADKAKDEATQPAGDQDAGATAVSKSTPEREAAFKDYVRIFSYAKKWDYVLLVAAALTSIGAGIVSPYANPPLTERLTAALPWT